MSFLEQERALFDLLFDRSLRADFCRNGTAALGDYQLEDHEMADFKTIRPDAIEFDASMRIYLILTQLCRQFPVTFSLLSSFSGGMNLLKAQINLQTMRCHPAERATVYATQLRQQLSNIIFDSANENAMITAILEAELGMAWTSATLKKQAIEMEAAVENTNQLSADYLQRPVKLAAYVSAAIIPQSYTQLKSALCPCQDTALWTHLSKTQLSSVLRKKTLAHEDPKLFVTRAHLSKFSRCEATVDHYTAELSEGFAPLFQHVNGTNSVAQIIEQLRQIGAADQILQGVEAGFHQLFTNGMLECT